MKASGQIPLICICYIASIQKVRRMIMDEIISTTGLSKQYGKVLAVDNIDLKVPHGSVYGFLGPNGAGKSTTMKLILGLAHKTAGTISIFNKAVNHRNRLSILKEIGSLIESPSYYGHLTGEENLQLFCKLKGVPEKDIDRVLGIVRLDQQKQKYVNHYSMGMKQRLGLANALLGNPKLLILDEPTNGLDPAGMQEIRELICTLPAQYDMTVMVSSHLLSEIDQMATSVGIINKGKLIFQDDLSALHEKSSQKIAIRTLNNKAAERILFELGISFQIQDGYLLLPKLNDNRIALCVQKLIERNVNVVRVEERKHSLEDIFLELTGKAGSL